VEIPEHEKLAKVKDKSQAIGEFLTWLTHDRGCEICEYLDDEDPEHLVFMPVRDGIQELLADYFGIDLDLLEMEKQALLEEQQRCRQEDLN